MEKIWSNVNGKVVDYTAQLAISPVTNTPEAGINNDTESAEVVAVLLVIFLVEPKITEPQK